MLSSKESLGIVETHLNEFGKNITILKIFVISNHLNKDLSKNVPISMCFNFSKNTGIIAILLLRRHLDQKLQCNPKCLWFRSFVMKFLKQVVNCFRPTSIQLVEFTFLYLLVFCV